MAGSRDAGPVRAHDRGRLGAEPTVASGWTARRGPERPHDRAPTALTLSWVAALPPSVRLDHLLASYPRVANRLALCWADVLLTERLFDDLLMDKRVGRKGFPAPVAMELKRLHEHFHTRHAIDEPHNPWDMRSQAVADR